MLNSSLISYSKAGKNHQKNDSDDSCEDEILQVRKFNIDTKSLKTLDPLRKLNDNVVDIYMNILLDKMPESLRDKIHLFSNFFFSKLKSLTPHLDSVKQTVAQRWDKNVKLFEKSYLVIPICDGGHWFMAIICYPSLVKSETIEIDLDQQVNDSRPTTPKSAIIIFDSLKVKYLPRFATPIREYLRLRWKYERPNELPKIFDKRTIPIYYARSFKQHNGYDCGVFMLHYFEKFFNNPLLTFCRVRDGSDLRGTEWEINCRQKRAEIRQTIKQNANETCNIEDMTSHRL